MALALLWPLSTQTVAATEEAVRVEMHTNRGAFVIEVYPAQAPRTVENFLRYVQDGFYDGTLFHRVLKGLLIQGGGFQPGMLEKATRTPIANEAQHCMPNTRGTVAMAHAADANTAAAQFFVNLADNHGLDFDATASAGAGYCAFGRVAGGMRTIYAIAQSAVVAGGDFMGDVPTEEIIIESARVLPADARSGDDNGKAAYELGDDHLGP